MQIKTSESTALKNFQEEHARKYNEGRTRYTASIEYHQYINEQLLERLPKDSCAKVLDNMCGTGIFFKALHQAYGHVLGLDVSMAMLRYAKEQNKAIVQGDARSLPFGEAAFDAVVCRGGLHEIPHRREAFAEAARVLKQGGILLLLEPADNSKLISTLRKIVYSIYRKSFDCSKERGLSFRELEDWAKENGLAVKELTSFGFIGYGLLCNADVFRFNRWLSYLPGARRLCRFFSKIDEILARTSLFRNLSFQLIGSFIKK